MRGGVRERQKNTNSTIVVIIYSSVDKTPKTPNKRAYVLKTTCKWAAILSVDALVGSERERERERSRERGKGRKRLLRKGMRTHFHPPSLFLAKKRIDDAVCRVLLLLLAYLLLSAASRWKQTPPSSRENNINLSRISSFSPFPHFFTQSSSY